MHEMKLVIAEKPSVAQSLARVIGATKRRDGYLEGNGYLVSWCVGHLVELSAWIPETHNYAIHYFPISGVAMSGVTPRSR